MGSGFLWLDIYEGVVVILFSIVICCHNSGEKIGKTLLGINAAILMVKVPVQIILVDNNCQDNTVALATSFCAERGLDLSLVTEKTPGLTFARVAGIEKSEGRWLCFVDDDNFIQPDYLVVAQKIIEANDCIDVIGGQSRFPSEYKVPGWAYQVQNSFAVGKQYESSGPVASPGVVWGAGLFVRGAAIKRLLLSGWRFTLTGRAGGQMLGGDDSELVLALRLYGASVYYCEDLILDHYVDVGRFSLTCLYQTSYGFGFSRPFLAVYETAERRQKYFSLRVLLEALVKGVYYGLLSLLPWMSAKYKAKFMYSLGCFWSVIVNRRKINNLRKSDFLKSLF